MKKPKRNNEVVPVDIRQIRQKLGLSLKEMCFKIAVISNSAHYSYIPETRLAEWENNWRPIPDYVFTAIATVLLDYWSKDRHMASNSREVEVDVYYGTALNKPLGDMFQLELELSRSRYSKLRNLLIQIQQVRFTQINYLEAVLQIDMSYVFDPLLSRALVDAA